MVQKVNLFAGIVVTSLTDLPTDAGLDAGDDAGVNIGFDAGIVEKGSCCCTSGGLSPISREGSLASMQHRIARKPPIL